MRTTIRLDDEILERLKARARREKVSLTRMLNRTLRAGLQSGGTPARRRRPYREQVHSLGTPHLQLGKALGLAASMEDEEIVRELALRR